ncbi:hypothetical protein OAA62_00225 [bacterium]|nr:hypothetical protein [bacterium]
MITKSTDIVYSEHDYDECFEYKDGSGRVPDGLAVGYIHVIPKMKQETFFLFDDITYSKHDHKYWNNLELEKDINRIII